MLVARYDRLVFRVAWSYVRERESALDICQEVFLAAYRSLPEYRGDGPFRSWLTRIAHRRSANWRRDRLRDLRREVPWEEARSGEPGGSGPAPLLVSPPEQESEILAAEARRGLLDRLDRLNSRQRVALTMRYFERAPIPEIARSLECTEGVARNILFRGLQELRRRLDPPRSRT